MQKLFFSLLLTFLCSGMYSQSDVPADSTGLPGDQFSLSGALALFKNSTSPEDFEKSINSEASNVNNLDLDEDNNTDYIKVISKVEGDMQLIIMQVAISESENQDIAVFEIEKTGNETATLQLIGDEDIFGEEVILEASDGGDNDDAHEPNSKRGGPSIIFDNNAYIVVNVWGWPCVNFVYGPAYRPWISPYRWRVYPNWYRPWRPLGWGVWHPHRYHRHVGFRYASTHRIVRAHKIYTPMRVRSKTVTTKTTVARNNYKVSRTKTTVKGPRGGTRTRTSTKVKTPRGTATKTKTSSRRGRGN